MKKRMILTACFLIFCGQSLLWAQAQGTEEFYRPNAFISLEMTLGRHNVIFKDFAKAPGMSFGFQVNLGIYVIRKEDFRGGFQYTLIEGASNNEDRRRLSEEFVLPQPEFDKHIVFKFAQFRSSSVGWFSELDAGNVTLYHQIGFGIFGLTERDQLFDFAMHNQIGVLLRAPEAFRIKLGLIHDVTVGTGNPNYDVTNLGFTFGGFKSF
ncbi:MAG: hypothetical protein NW226_27175 [Microscillaceae bacterium]|nr:hypothetical protein [Microscillaceae bacterium]